MLAPDHLTHSNLAGMYACHNVKSILTAHFVNSPSENYTFSPLQSLVFGTILGPGVLMLLFNGSTHVVFVDTIAILIGTCVCLCPPPGGSLWPYICGAMGGWQAVMLFLALKHQLSMESCSGSSQVINAPCQKHSHTDRCTHTLLCIPPSSCSPTHAPISLAPSSCTPPCAMAGRSVWCGGHV